jgi:hypothetical protein
MLRWHGLFEVGIGLTVFILSIPIISMSFPPPPTNYADSTFYKPESPNLPLLLMGSIGVFVGIVLIIEGLRRSILRGRSMDLPRIPNARVSSGRPRDT